MASGLVLPGLAGSFASTPDTGVLDIVGDIDLRADATQAVWTGIQRTFLGKWGASGTNSSYMLDVDASAIPRVFWSDNGTNVLFLPASQAIPITTGRIAIRAALDVNNGAGGRSATFWTAPTIDGPWTQLGSVVSAAGTTSIFNSTAALEAGSFAGGASGNWAGTLHAVEVRNGIDGTVVANPKFWQPASGTASFVDGAGRTWTVSGGAALSHGTPTYSLPFQVAADRPCDAADPWCALRDLVASEMAVTAAVLGRTDPAKPAAVVTLTAPVTMTPPSVYPVRFDTIEFDNDGMVDFDRSVEAVRPRRAGVYAAIGYAEIGPGVFPEELRMGVMAGPSGPDILSPTTSHFFGSGFDAMPMSATPTRMRVVASMVWTDASAADVTQFGFGLVFTGNTSPTLSLTTARFGLFWRRDAP